MILDGIWVLCMDGDVNLCLKMRVRLRSITVGRYEGEIAQNHKKAQSNVDHDDITIHLNTHNNCTTNAHSPNKD